MGASRRTDDDDVLIIGLIGNAMHDPERYQTTSGKPVSNIRLATNRMAGGEERSQFQGVGFLGRRQPGGESSADASGSPQLADNIPF